MKDYTLVARSYGVFAVTHCRLYRGSVEAALEAFKTQIIEENVKVLIKSGKPIRSHIHVNMEYGCEWAVWTPENSKIEVKTPDLHCKFDTVYADGDQSDDEILSISVPIYGRKNDLIYRMY